MDYICAPRSVSGILNWSDEALERLGNIDFSGDGSLRAKQLHAARCLFELFFNELIAPASNISRSPGSETCLGIFGNTDCFHFFHFFPTNSSPDLAGFGLHYRTFFCTVFKGHGAPARCF